SAFDSEPLRLRNAASTSSPCANVVAKEGSGWSSGARGREEGSMVERAAISKDWSKFGTLSIYRNEFANRIDIRLGSASKDGRRHGFRSFRSIGSVAGEAAGLLRRRSVAAPS